MSLGFILGTAAMDHRSVMVNQLARDMHEHPTDQFFYLVPNHIKFESEINIMDELSKSDGDDHQEGFAQSQLQVLSFSRLAWYLLRNTPACQVPRISTTGMSMLVYQIISDHAGELRLFAGEVHHPGFVAQLVGQLEQLKQANITADDLAHMAQQITSANPTFSSKLHDLTLVYHEYEQALLGRYLGNAEVYDQLVKYLQENDFGQAHFYLARFSQFTANEQKIVSAIIKNASSVIVSLDLDQASPHEDPDVNSLFFESGKVYHHLYEQAVDQNVEFLGDQYANQVRVSHEIQALDKFWIADTKMAMIDRVPVTHPENLQIFTGDSRLTELQQVARQIRQLVASGKYRYRDFLVLARRLDAYSSFLEPVFEQYNIPAFNDHEKMMDDHPLVLFLDALFAVKQHYYRYDDLMQLLKTGLLLPRKNGEFIARSEFESSLFLTENWLLKTGLHGDDWLRDDDWQYYQFSNNDTGTTQSQKVERVTKQINMIRHFVKNSLPPLFDQLENATTGREAALALYQFMVETGVTEQLNVWQNRQLEAGELDAASQPQQVWQTFCNILDEYVTILGDRPFNPDDFRELLQAGFSAASYSQIPSTLDQVTVSETGIVQSDRRKITFMIGATDSAMPTVSTSQSLLTDADKEALQPQLTDDQFLPADNVEQLANEPFVNYLGFMSGCERLYLSYPQLDDDGEAVQASPYVTSIASYFGITTRHYYQVPQLDDGKIAPYVGSADATLSSLVQVSRQAADLHETVPLKWRFIYQQLANDPQTFDKVQTVMASLHYQNQPVKLRPEIVKGLYGDVINTSVSKLEEFYQNQYEYFLEFGLKLKERDMFELTPANTGEFFHSSLDQLIKRINQQHLTLNEITNDQLDDLINQVVDNISQAPQFMILASSARMKYLTKQLRQTIHQMGRTLKQQSAYTPAKPVQTEVLFGQIQDQKELDALIFDLADNRQVRVRGKIDRIDQLSTQNGDYLGVVDYKSSDHSFNFGDAYYGLAMQMLTYLNAVQKNITKLDTSEKAQLAGALYMHIFDPKLSLDKIGDDIDQARMKEHKYKGILLNDQDLLDDLDRQLEDDYGFSAIYPFRKTKKGFSSEYLVTDEQLDMLLKRNKERIINAANQIFDGQVSLNPVKWPDQRTALQMSPYLDVFQFDNMLKENNYRQLDSLKPKDVFDKLAEEDDDE
ncbi:PD-(D/E)XK nuclease family protein [Paucilactobacillus suebicus]|uniref:ATP-dependent helicase/deoxyribonuclease subunit B n=1 Tax=Paucilactobacillus suebicus DSM 5007 = KCTC 3549 TaxID=1423807 RepID=A0A0R1W4A9_9LACO|nr:PD-(D/E)XK nuclease family protein [Paucilactobacillus suebicus]KRM12672.1 ATP-dependent helicase deoxyribonuclease subunit B [Paucilactobacillus suebicus DSM 5007 = KCTC 3549]